ncbi:bromodomain-containing protein [Phthorimaea operculella]|nr:bromodomain-containing protein [Phthorimaea operculella]
MNLRGLLTPARANRPHQAMHPAQQAMQQAYQQMMGAYANNAAYAASQANMAGVGGRRSNDPRTPSPAPQHPLPALPAPQNHQQVIISGLQGQSGLLGGQSGLNMGAPPLYQHAKWHIPQHQANNGGTEPIAGSSVSGDNFKITLSRQNTPRQPSLVTSTNPKTPSPSLHGTVPMELDKVCAESVQDLMATIAKLDSNGVQVVAENAEPSPSPAPSVHSSTDAHNNVKPLTAAVTASGPSDPNEDWCAVCMDGGELMCCDKCPKVFHQYCHIPTIEKLPDETETWQCLLCVNFAELPPDTAPPPGGGLSPRMRKIIERVTLELYCQYEPSLAFREPVPTENIHYHSKIQHPMCLDMIRMKLQPGSPQLYTHPAQFVSDCRLMFRNAYHYNPADSQIYKDAKRLEEFFDAQLLKWLPDLAYWSGEGEPPAKRARQD